MRCNGSQPRLRPTWSTLPRNRLRLNLKVNSGREFPSGRCVPEWRRHCPLQFASEGCWIRLDLCLFGHRQPGDREIGCLHRMGTLFQPPFTVTRHDSNTIFQILKGNLTTRINRRKARNESVYMIFPLCCVFLYVVFIRAGEPPGFLRT
jgi:hypothetical protein